MFQGILQSTSVPVLEQVVQFSRTRHDVLAGNLANLHTPGYRVRDVSVDEFQGRLKEAIEAGRQPAATGSPGELGASSPFAPRKEREAGGARPIVPVAEVAENSKGIVYHDDSNVSVEHQVTEMVKNQMQHNLALAILGSQLRLLQTAISERV